MFKPMKDIVQNLENGDEVQHYDKAGSIAIYIGGVLRWKVTNAPVGTYCATRCEWKKVEPEKIYKVGDYFSGGVFGGPYVLASMGNKKVAFINMHSGSRANDSLKVGDIYHITEPEFRELSRKDIYVPVKVEITRK